MILYIDTTDFNSVSYALKSGAKTIKKSYKVDPHQSHETLAKLENFLKLAKVKPSNIKKIIINKGPGSFTGIRVGVAHALALSLVLNVPLQALKNLKFYSKSSEKH